MLQFVFKGSRRGVVLVCAAVVAACGGGGGGSPPPPPPPPPPPSTVTISGSVTYDFVPTERMARPGGGFTFRLNYSGTEARPAREVTVQFISGSAVLAATQTDDSGQYSLDVPPSRTGFIRVRAESIRTATPTWNFRVVDNVNGDAIYALDGDTLSSGTADSVRNLHAASGWTGSSYGEERAAAPFAILDTAYIGAEFVAAAGVTTLPPLMLHWSTENLATFGADGEPDATTGELGTSFYHVNTAQGLNGIYLLGDENNDTEEYDPYVILHEFAHYLARQLGRTESIGGPHARGDYLDMRVAFSEGWATAFAALVLGDPIFVDIGGAQQSGSYSFDVEGLTTGNPAPGWYSEQSVWELIYDLFDANNEAGDAVALPFDALWSVMIGRLVTTPALVSIYPFINAVKDAHPGDIALIDQLTAGQDIAPVTTDFGTNETNDAGSADVLPIYSELTVNGPAVNVCSTDEFSSNLTGSTNKLSSRRFLRFTPPVAGPVTIAARATEIPAGAYADPDWILHRFQPVWNSNQPPNAACENIDAPGWTPGNCVEPDPANGPATLSLINAEYVLEIFEWTNTNDISTDPDYPPIGRTCFDITVTQ